MIMRKNPAHDTETPPGQVVWPYPATKPKVLGEIIDRIQRAEVLPIVAGIAPGTPVPSPDYERGYAEGYIEGKQAGFNEGLIWMKGK